jgi:mRNA interferase MazF
MVIRQGDIYWVDLNEPSGSEPGYSHPYVVVQNNVFNTSKINTVVVCALTSSIKRAQSPGNVLLEQGEADLPKQSVVMVSQIFTVDKSQLGEFIGKLPAHRIKQILDGIDLLLEPRDLENS